jgi:hypothetical protein
MGMTKSSTSAMTFICAGVLLWSAVIPRPFHPNHSHLQPDLPSAFVRRSRPLTRLVGRPDNLQSSSRSGIPLSLTEAPPWRLHIVSPCPFHHLPLEPALNVIDAGSIRLVLLNPMLDVIFLPLRQRGEAATKRWILRFVHLGDRQRRNGGDRKIETESGLPLFDRDGLRCGDRSRTSDRGWRGRMHAVGFRRRSNSSRTSRVAGDPSRRRHGVIGLAGRTFSSGLALGTRRRPARGGRHCRRRRGFRTARGKVGWRRSSTLGSGGRSLAETGIHPLSLTGRDVGKTWHPGLRCSWLTTLGGSRLTDRPLHMRSRGHLHELLHPRQHVGTYTTRLNRSVRVLRRGE